MLFSELLHPHLFPATVAALIILIAFSLVLYAYVKRKINTSALIGTLILGAIILLALGPRFGCAGVLVLLAFFLSGNLVTKYKYDRKAELGVAEGNKGRRQFTGSWCINAWLRFDFTCYACVLVWRSKVFKNHFFAHLHLSPVGILRRYRGQPPRRDSGGQKAT